MEVLKFKTNIKCEGCLSKIKPLLDEVVGTDNWEVDLRDAQKILTIVGSSAASDVVSSMKTAGFTAEEI